MKLREYGVLLFELSKSNVDTETYNDWMFAKEKSKSK